MVRRGPRRRHARPATTTTSAFDRVLADNAAWFAHAGSPADDLHRTPRAYIDADLLADLEVINRHVVTVDSQTVYNGPSSVQNIINLCTTSDGLQCLCERHIHLDLDVIRAYEQDQYGLCIQKSYVLLHCTEEVRQIILTHFDDSPTYHICTWSPRTGRQPADFDVNLSLTTFRVHGEPTIVTTLFSPDRMEETNRRFSTRHLQGEDVCSVMIVCTCRVCDHIMPDLARLLSECGESSSGPVLMMIDHADILLDSWGEKHGDDLQRLFDFFIDPVDRQEEELRESLHIIKCIASSPSTI
ncbi:hypothetical protein JKP88DRAFT_288203 [Tribonema minus]|uniref:Uncharacterized protein n=1 Tax=Tribonema minus TaxID=303371 RepID=A0A835Z6Z5_9STRA|nr:hypothetical protein JKP88DRAFT_288203 [Tribonema minus]